MIAACFLISVPVMIIQNRRDVATSEKDHKEWLLKNPAAKEGKDGRLTFTLPLKDGHFVEIEGDANKSREEAIDHVKSAGYHVDESPEPYIATLDYSNTLAILVSAISLFFIGRALRYMIAGE